MAVLEGVALSLGLEHTGVNVLRVSSLWGVTRLAGGRVGCGWGPQPEPIYTSRA